MATPESLEARARHVQALFVENGARIARLQDQFRDSLVPELVGERSLDALEASRVERFATEPSTIWRFLRRARFDEDDSVGAAEEMDGHGLIAAVEEHMRKAINSRLDTGLDALNMASLDPMYLEGAPDGGLPLYSMHPRLKDRLGRPAAVLRLDRVQRTEDGSLEALKEFILAAFEASRRYMLDLTERAADDKPVLQLVLILDLQGAGMSNLEMELLPFMLGAMRDSYPSMVGAIFVIGYTWAFAGMWQLAKRLLPRPALDRILFPSLAELQRHFSPDNLLREHGGSVAYRYQFKGSILARYGRPSWPGASGSGTATPMSGGSQTPSRQPSLDSLSELGSPVDTLRRQGSAQALLDARFSPRMYDDDFLDVEDPERFPHWAHPPGIGDIRSVPPSAAPSRDPSPSRRSNSSGSGRRGMHSLSRFSETNPAFGYRQVRRGTSLPTPSTAADRPLTLEPRPRRRWRDLFKTLAYLLALRFLAAHRAAERMLQPFLALLARLGIRRQAPKSRSRALSRARAHGGAIGGHVHLSPPQRKRKAVTWGSEVEEHPPRARGGYARTRRRRDVDSDLEEGGVRPISTLAAYAFLLFIVVRSPWGDRALKRVLMLRRRT